jgi:hypothetical protein
MIITPKFNRNIKAMRTKSKKANLAMIVLDSRKLDDASTTEASPKPSTDLDIWSDAADTLSLIDDASELAVDDAVAATELAAADIFDPTLLNVDPILPKKPGFGLPIGCATGISWVFVFIIYILMLFFYL